MMIKMTTKQYDWYSRHFYGDAPVMTEMTMPYITFTANTSGDVPKISRLEKIFSDYKIEKHPPITDRIKVQFDEYVVIAVIAFNTKNRKERVILGQCQAIFLGKVLQRTFVKYFLDEHPDYAVGFEIMANVDGVYMPLQ